MVTLVNPCYCDDSPVRWEPDKWCEACKVLGEKEYKEALARVGGSEDA